MSVEGKYEGLVKKTTIMFHELVGLEREDMEQELWLKIVKARRTYNPTRSKLTERAYVYGCVANFVKDLKRDRARRVNGPLQVTHIEGYAQSLSRNEMYDGDLGLDWFDARYMRVSREEVYGAVEDGTFVMPSTVTDEEQEIVYLLVIGYAQTEIALTLGIEYSEITKLMRLLRQKLADWCPPPPPQELVQSVPVVAQPTAIAA